MLTRDTSAVTSRLVLLPTVWRICTRSATPLSVRILLLRQRLPRTSPRRGGTLPRLAWPPGGQGGQDQGRILGSDR